MLFNFKYTPLVVQRLCLAIACIMPIGSYAQINYGIQQNITTFIINGVSSIEDIGGVECNALKPQNSSTFQRVQFINYNDFNVSVLYKLEILDSYGTISYKTGTIVLSNGESKTIDVKYQTLGDIRLITRKIGNVTPPIQNNSDELCVVAGYLVKYPYDIPIKGRANAEEFIYNMNAKRVYKRTNWRLPTDAELKLLNYNNSNNNYYSHDNWNRYNIHPSILVVVSTQ